VIQKIDKLQKAENAPVEGDRAAASFALPPGDRL
jgi:hypothetical protein